MPDLTTRLPPITFAEQETGLSKELLRARERSYGFPAPLRDPQGDRLYPPDQIPRLRLLRALTDRGELAVHQEHLFSQVLARCLQQSIARLAAHAPGAAGRDSAPSVLLTTIPGEMHELGLLMVEAVLAAHGVRCVNLGTQMPLDDVVAAAKAHACTVVALSFSSSFSARLAATALIELRKALPADVAIWAGGANAGLRTGLPAGVQAFAGLAGIAPAIAALKRERALT